MNNSDNKKRVYTGIVQKLSSDKTIIVTITRKVKHSLLKKYYNKTKKFMVHDAENIAKYGDVVLFSSSKPISKRKSYILQSVTGSKS